MKVKLIASEKFLRAGGLARSTIGSAGHDVFNLDGPFALAPGEHKRLDLGFKVDIPYTTMAALLLPRSGLGTGHGIVLRNVVGLVDSDYQGQVMATLVNTSTESYSFKNEDRIAQLVFVPVYLPDIELVDSFDSETERGESGHGSSGR